METLKEFQGAFVESLVRNNKKIREDRAISIVEEAELLMKRKVEDLETSIKKLKRERDNMIDLSPENADSLILAADFNGDQFTNKYLEIGLRIRNEEIKLEIARKSYSHLFEGAE